MRLHHALVVEALRLLLLLGLAAEGGCLRVSGVMAPPVVASGSTVQLRCNYEHTIDRPDPLYSVKWYRDVNQFYEFIPKRNPPIRVYPLPNINVDKSRSSRETVTLTAVTRETSGAFRCEVMGDKPFFETDDHSVNMTVVDVPSWGPELRGVVQGARVRPHELIMARCVAGHSDPPAAITWTINSLEPPRHAHFQRSMQRDQRGRHMQVSELKVMVTKASFRRGAMTLSCEVRVSTVFMETVNVTLIDMGWPNPAEFGWFSSGPSQLPSLPLLAISLGVFSLEFV